MRIAFFSDTFLPQVNGVAAALANQATELGLRGHNVLIFTPKLDDIPRKQFKAKNVQVVHLPTIPALVYPEFKLGVFGLPKVIKYLIRFKPDIIHLHSPMTVGMDAILAAKLLKKPLVGTVHIYFSDSEYLRWLKYNLAVKLANKVAQRFLNFMFNQCDLALVPSKKLANALKSDGFRKPITYLRNGITLRQPKTLNIKAKNALKKKYVLKEKVVLHFGRLSHEKNVDSLIKSFAYLAKKHSDTSLLIIGDGPAKKGLIKLSEKLDIKKNVIFTGFIDHQFLISSGLLLIGDIFATASTMENNPMVVLESMMFGLPIVGVKQAGLIELVSTNGYLIQPGQTQLFAEKMEKILFDKTIAASMKEQSIKLIQPFSIDKVVDQLLGLYQTLQSELPRT